MMTRLPAFGVVDAFGASADRGVELFERLGFLLERLLVEHVEHLLHGLARRGCASVKA